MVVNSGQLNIDPFVPVKVNWSRPFEGSSLSTYFAWIDYARKHRIHGRRLEDRAISAIRKIYDQPNSKISFKHLFEVIRWEDTELKKRKEDQFKISNTWHSYYARAFRSKYPLLAKFIDIRELK